MADLADPGRELQSLPELAGKDVAVHLVHQNEAALGHVIGLRPQQTKRPRDPAASDGHVATGVEHQSNPAGIACGRERLTVLAVDQERALPHAHARVAIPDEVRRRGKCGQVTRIEVTRVHGGQPVVRRSPLPVLEGLSAPDELVDDAHRILHLGGYAHGCRTVDKFAVEQVVWGLCTHPVGTTARWCERTRCSILAAT
ncbi:MAG TPA: hypothetical protein VFD59_14515 [Nocardioidaceae bacterium]|nr:hypothetical protein [Nocardioidaceae bacterium]